MGKIVDPDEIVQTTDVVYDTSAKTIQLLITGAISDTVTGKESGITGKCIYSFTKEEWHTDADLNKFRFPIKMIYEASFQLINGWSFADQQTIDLVRDAGFQDIVNSDERACIITLGNMNDPTDGNDKAYYDQIEGYDDNTTVALFDKFGEVNENILTDDGTDDYTGYLKVYLREEQKTYAEYNLLPEQGLSALKYEAYKLPLSNGLDSKAIDDDEQIGTTGTGSLTGVTYASMALDYVTGKKYVTADSIVTNNAGAVILLDVLQDDAGRWFRCTTAGDIDATDKLDLDAMGGAGSAVFEVYPGERQVGTSYYAFNRLVKCDDGTNLGRTTEVHSWGQYQLRQTGIDINGDAGGDAYGTVYGEIAALLTYFVGDQMHGYGGVYFDSLNAADNSNVTYHDITAGTFGGGNVEGTDYGLDGGDIPVVSTNRNNPFLSSFTLEFSSNLIDETLADTLYRVYFKNDDAGDNTARDFDTADAIVVNDKDGTPITGTIGQNETFQYAFSTNVQRGAASANTDAPIVVVFQGLNDSEWSEAEFTITESTSLKFACNASDELNFENT